MISYFLQSRQLRGIERALRGSEPHLAAMLAIFARLNAEEALVSPEQTRQGRHGAAAVLLLLAGATAGVAALVRRAFGWVARVCVLARRRLGGRARSPLGTVSAAEERTQARRSPGL